jgi:periplasmic divalent cation tolerance protein
MPDHCIVMTTTDSYEEAEMIARSLLEKRLAACVQIQSVDSFYRWNGEIGRDAEKLLFCKTADDRFEALRDAILALHSYETPEIVRVPITGGLDRYLTWLVAETR